jgi:outer membrane protein assembly factor BamE (lipoprotein component of BamABCDE complex)
VARLNTVLIFLTLTLTGCIVLPAADRGDGQGKYIESSSILFLEVGKTKRLDVVERLGEPDIIWETERIHVYRSERVVGHVLWALPTGPYTAAVGGTDAIERRVLLIRFDAADIVQRFDFLELGSSESLGEVLRRWHASDKQTSR